MDADEALIDAGAIDSLSPAEHRARYLELKRVALATAAVFGSAAPAATAPHELSSADIIAGATIPGGWNWSVRLVRGQTLRIVNTSGTPGVSAFFGMRMIAVSATTPAIPSRFNGTHG